MIFHEPKPGSKPTSIVGSPGKTIWTERLIQRHDFPLANPERLWNDIRITRAEDDDEHSDNDHL
jgi:hypothetical protein